MSETVGSLFFPESLESSLRERAQVVEKALGAKGHSVLVAGGHALGDGLRQMMDIPISTLLVRGWSTHKKLRDLVAKESPEKMILFDLGEHTITSQHHPRIELLMAEQVISSLTFDLDLSLTFRLGRLQIQHRRVMRATTGACVGEGKLSLAGTPIASRPTKEIALPGEMSFGEGLPLFVGTAGGTT
jgi:hypothetical protein